VTATERVAAHGVDVVEVHKARGRYAISLRRQLELRHDPAYRAGQRRDDDRTDPVCNGVSRENEDRPVAAGSRCNQISPRRIGPVRPVLCWTPVGDRAERPLVRRHLG
jgi:hypothetical protein